MRRVKQRRNKNQPGGCNEELCQHRAACACRRFPARRTAGAGANSRPSFFLTSNGIGNGGNLGGLAGADNHCQSLAQAAGFGAPKTWRAYCRPRRPMASLR